MSSQITVLTPEERIINAWHSGWAPDPELTVSEWADDRRVLAGEGSVEPGKWRTMRTPYLKEPMDCLSPTHPVRQVKVMKGSQLGWTEAGNNFLGFIIDMAPGPTAMFMPNEDMAKKHAQLKLNPSIDATPVLREKIREAKRSEAKDTILTKIFKGGYLILATAGSAAALSSLSIKYLFLDEIDRYKADVGGEGDPVGLAENRTDAYKSVCKIYKVSTPTVKGLSRIEQEIADSDQRRYHVPCPHCGKMQYFKWSGITFEKDNKYNLTSEVTYRCEECNRLIDEFWKTDMMGNGIWKPHNPGHEHRGYILPSFYSPVGWLSWTDIVKEFLIARKFNDATKLKKVVNTRWAETWTEGEETVSESSLISRRENYGPKVPIGAVILTAGVDVQADRIEVEVDAWGVGEESWSMEHKILYGDPVRGQVWNDLEEYIIRLWKHELGIPLPISGVAIDTGYLTQQCYTFVKQRQLRRVYGYPQYVFAIKGASEPLKPFLNRTTKNNVAKVNLFSLGVNTAKDTIHSKFKITAPGPGYVHHNYSFDEEYFKQLTSEIRKKKKGVRIWEARPGAKTEGIDLKVYAMAALGLLPSMPEGLEKLAERMQDRVRKYKEQGGDSASGDNPIISVPRKSTGRRIISKGISHK